MSKFSVSSLKAPKVRLPSKKVLLIAAAIIAGLAIVACAAAAWNLSQKNQEAADRQAQKSNTALISSKDAEIARLKVAADTYKADRDFSCTYLAGLTKTPVVQRYVIVPTAAHCGLQY